MLRGHSRVRGGLRWEVNPRLGHCHAHVRSSPSTIQIAGSGALRCRVGASIVDDRNAKWETSENKPVPAMVVVFNRRYFSLTVIATLVILLRKVSFRTKCADAGSQVPALNPERTTLIVAGLREREGAAGGLSCRNETS
jgi:hypothetical protein